MPKKHLGYWTFDSSLSSHGLELDSTGFEIERIVAASVWFSHKANQTIINANDNASFAMAA